MSTIPSIVSVYVEDQDQTNILCCIYESDAMGGVVYKQASENIVNNNNNKSKNLLATKFEI